MAGVKVSAEQRSLIKTKSKTKNTIFLEGPAGTGKTTVGVERMLYMLKDEDIPADSILVIVPQRTLGLPYDEALRRPDVPPGGQVTVATIGSVGRQMIELFWPLVAGELRFKSPEQPPVFLSLETAQYYMARLVRPLIEKDGYFDTITIDRNRLYSQILDALNKSATVGFPHFELAQRLKAAWVGDPAQLRAYDELQDCAESFRAYCLEHNLLDYSLQVEAFVRHLWKLPECNRYLTARYQHLIIDNVEEDHPAAHQILTDWIRKAESALVIYDTDAGYRRFLGADDESAYELKKLCKRKEVFTESFVTTPDLDSLSVELARGMSRSIDLVTIGEARKPLVYETHRFQTQMIDWVADQVAQLVHGQKVPPSEIAILAPFLSDALRFTIMNRLSEQDVPSRSHRPSRALRDEAATQWLVTLAQLAHPEWQLRPTLYDVTYALMGTISGLDLVRAQLLAQIVYRAKDGMLSAFDQITPPMQERITYTTGNYYEVLRNWLEDYKNVSERLDLDIFLSRLFSEVLSQPGFGFHQNFDAAEQAANLIDSARQFRHIIGSRRLENKSIAQEYVEMVNDGVIANQYIRGWDMKNKDAVLVAPAYTFLMTNQPISYQFWLNVGSPGWSERLYQPLTHPFVLAKGWDARQKWTDELEFSKEQEGLYRLILGLIHRCRTHIYLGFSELSEQGFEQRGRLLDAIQRMLRRLSMQDGALSDDIQAAS
jgi:superfamily I DNA/RNA helicase